MLKKYVRFLSILTIFGLFLALMTMQSRPSRVASAQSDDIPQPLPNECEGVAPLDDPNACCAFGYIYFNNEPIAGAMVHIESADATWDGTTGDHGVSDDPHYQVDLTTDLQVEPGDVITITVSHNDMVSMRTWTVQPGSQQVDLGLLEGYQASSPLSVNTAFDQLAPHRQGSGYRAMLAGASTEPEEGQMLTNVANLSYTDAPAITTSSPDALNASIAASSVFSVTELKLTASDGAQHDEFGYSVSIDGNVAIFGAPEDDDNGLNSGAAIIYRLHGNQWVEEAKLLASDGTEDDHFGKSVSISGDVALVGAPYNDHGSAYIYRWNGSQWQEEAKLASFGHHYGRSGYSVSIDGNVALVGTPYDRHNGLGGSVYIYRWDGSQWQEESKLLPNDGSFGDDFGYSVSIDGDVALIGANRDNDNGSDSGSAYIYRWNGSHWIEEAKLLASDGDTLDLFGNSVSIDSNVALVGAYNSDSGSAYIYRWDGSQWQEETKLLASDGANHEKFGYSVSIDRDVALVGAYEDDDNGPDSGSAYIYRFDGSQWQEESKLLASDGAEGDYFGNSVSINGDLALVGAYLDDDNGTDSGSAYVYDLSFLTTNVIYVNHAALGGNNGTSWADAYTDLQDALAAAQEGDEIWVAAGTYKPTERTEPDDLRSATFQLINGVTVYGGFNGTETARDQRDWEVNATILSGDLNGNDNDNVDPDDPTRADNSYHVVTGSSSTILDSFMITAGNANATKHINSGGINLGNSSTVTLNNITISGNTASGSGGGIYLSNSSTMTLNNSTISGNTTRGSGGGIYTDNSSTMTLNNSTISRNTAGGHGGGILSQSTVILNNSRVRDNTAVFEGGGINNNNHAVLILTNSTISDNNGTGIQNFNTITMTNSIVSDNDGRGIASFSSETLTVNNSTISGNTGIGLVQGQNSTSYIQNTILAGNSSSSSGPDCSGMLTSQGYNLIQDTTNCTITGNLTGNITEQNPLFVDAANGDFRLQAGSPAINAGNNDALPPDTTDLDGDGDSSEPIPVDLDGYQRVVNGTVDMGAYEYQGASSEVPTAAFSTSPISGTAPLNVTFTDESGGAITSWTWDFGDGNISGARYPAHRYTLPGTYTVSLTISGPDGSDSETKLDYITVSEPTEVKTLILTNRQKVAALHGEGAATQLMDKLDQLAAHERVKGLVIQVEDEPDVADAYVAWEGNPTSTDNANAVTSAIKGVLDGKLASYADIEYIVVAGDDRVIPFRRVRDRSGYRESRYCDQVSSDSATGAALCDDMTLTDDYYANRVPFVPRSHVWDGPPLYLPDLAIGRLIETPEEMMAQIDIFLADDGIAVSDAVVTGYTFVTDAAQKSCDVLNDAGVTTDCSLIGQTWNKNDFISQVLNIPHDVVSINGHADHYRIGAPNGPSLTSHQIANAPDIHQGALFYTIACHAGLNVPPDSPYPLDTAQALAQKQANYVANTGYGYGYHYSVGLSERLMLNFTKELTRNGQTTLGQALVDAKQRYYLRNYQFDYYDEKTLIQSTLYGLPMYEVSSASSLRAATGDELPDGVIVEELPIPLDGAFSKTQLRFELPALTEETTPDGTYYSLGGLIYSEHEEPIQPKLPFEVSLPGTNAHGLVFKGGTYSDINNFDPVIEQAFTLTVPSALLAEPPFSTTNWYPAILPRLNILNNGADAHLTAQLGQYNSTIAGGSERLYSELSVDIYYHSASDDWTVPSIHDVNSQLGADTAAVTVAVSDTSAIHTIVVAYTDGNGTWSSSELSASGNVWSGSFPASPDTEFFVQAVDQAGNVAVDDNDGAYYQPGESQLPVTMRLEPLTLTTSVGQTFEIAIEVQAGTQEVDGVSAYLNFDPASLEVVSITQSSELPVMIENEFNNSSGQIDLSTGALTPPFPAGNFTVATVTFRALAESDSTQIDFNAISPRQSDVTFDGRSVLASTDSGSVVIVNAILECEVDLQGRHDVSKPDPRWSVPLYVSLTRPGEGLPAYTFTPTTDQNGIFTVAGIIPGSYELRLKHSHTLQNKLDVTLVAGSNNLDCGSLREGDANNDNVVTIIDFSILATTFGRCEGTASYDERADFNEDGCVTILDFSLLASNFAQLGAPPWPTTTAAPERGAATTSSGQVALAMTPASSTVEVGEHFTVTLPLQTGEQLVDGAQIALEFDPQLLQVHNLTPGSMPLELSKHVDNSTGHITFAAGTLSDFPSGSFPLLQIQFRALAATEETTLAFQFDAPLPTDVTYGGTSVLGAHANSTITVQQKPTAISLESVEASPLLAPWLWALPPLGLMMLLTLAILRRRYT